MEVHEMSAGQIPAVITAALHDLPLAGRQRLHDEARVIPRRRCRTAGIEHGFAARQHLRPRPFGASASVTAAPPLTEIFFSFPPAKNPTHWPSGEKKGFRAPSVPD